MPQFDDETFARFAARHARDLRRISGHTRGEESIESVQSEAWLMALELAGKGVALDLDEPAHSKLLIAHVYQKLVRYTELNIRHAVRLDHGFDGDDEGAAHPLMRGLAADEQYDPLLALVAREEQLAQTSRATLHPQRSLAGAYLHLLDRFGQQMHRVAEHLMISLSYSYRRCAHARLLASFQQGLPAEAVREDAGFVPGPWRRFRLMRQPEQLSLDLGLDVGLVDDQDR